MRNNYESYLSSEKKFDIINLLDSIDNIVNFIHHLSDEENKIEEERKIIRILYVINAFYLQIVKGISTLSPIAKEIEVFDEKI